ncbi:MAG TPA: Lrp/AsnC family transcriptional regulator [Candidatus Bathyarchaeia archaeon]|nr:Lrp/AsnC family transcriptional regulator [Candidatus Bathyarchaeia archaeon]
METLTRRSTHLLSLLHQKGQLTNTYTLSLKQDVLAKQLGISRQALNVHLRRLRDANFIRTGRGFIDVTEEGLNALGISSIPAFVLLKVSPLKRSHAYQKIRELAIQRAFRIAGDMDALVMVEREKLDEVLSKLSSVDGILDTKSYVTIETIR